MFKNYIKIAWRNLLKNKSSFFLNCGGLAIGMASCILIAIYVWDELSYDRFYDNADDIARVVLRGNIHGEELKEAVVAAPIAKTFKKDLPQVKDATRLSKVYNPVIRYNNTSFENIKAAYVDSNFFDVFDLKFLKGDTKSPFENPNSVVLTSSEAKKYFGIKNPIGKRITVPELEVDLEVTAILQDMPHNTHLQMDVFIPMHHNERANSNLWVNSGFATYLLLEPNTQLGAVENQIPALMKKYMGEQVQQAIGISYEEFQKNNQIGLFLQPLTAIHLHSDFAPNTEISASGDIKYIYIFSAIAIFMLLIACINFMNLATATATKRSREVGIRKVLGSAKKQLVTQFLTESFITTLFAIILAVGLIALVLPYFNNLAGKELKLLNLFSLKSVLLLLSFVVLVSLFSGAYPAFVLSSFKPLLAIKNNISASGKRNNLRSSMVVFQFVISASLILATIVVYKQMQFIQHKKLGYDKEQVIVLRDAYRMGSTKVQSYKKELLKNPNIASVSRSAFVPAGETDNHLRGIFKNNEYLRKFFFYDVDEDYIATLGLELIEGRNFSSELKNEANKAIINEEAAKILALGDNPIGKTFKRTADPENEEFTVIGVIKNFHFKSLHHEIDPLVLAYNPYGGLILKTKNANIASVLNFAEEKWSNFNENEDFSYSFLDEAFSQTYSKEQQMGTILSIFTLLTIFVACLGLFGLITFATEQRFKEIGIRKVLGANVGEIVVMLAKEFIKLIFIAFLIAFPIGYYFMHQWLQDFAYRIDLSVWQFLMAAIITLAIALITISFKSIKAALRNPVKSLRTE
ncbi:ABC transporter permease [Zunongwangia sp. HGR-M22]|uniref:ABC transporter permease n=1 Tax=Zunongwangia sp. HGR-M22 TaxID=3015168 RepID=UPI0022DDCAC3|nr:ABC transporter permease [Zunongwangia sp. HGR-M22]WBL25761.1 ABC transporter permease [Zunongwangia sp. HGR-M22]